MRPGHHLIEHLLESGLNACRVHVEKIPAAHCCGPLHEPESGSPCGRFHLIGTEECLLMDPTLKERIYLHSGDLVISQSGTRPELLVMPHDRAELPATGFASILYGEFELPPGNTGPLLRGLPNHFVVRSRDASECYRQLVSIILVAALETRLGQQVLINKLASSLLAFALCECVCQIEAPHGVFAAINDARISRALQAIHERLDKQWSVRLLASVAGMSRSTFALSFTTVIGMPPMQYVALLRVNHAKQLLQNSGLSVAKVAEMLGYSSEAAFRKLFKRVEGVGPGNVRAAARYGDRSAGSSGNLHHGIR